MNMQLGQIERENLGLSMENARMQDAELELGTLTVAQRTAPMAVPAAVMAHNPPYRPAAAPHVVLPPHLRTQPHGYYDNGKPYSGR
jgi:hypothetical protein